MFHKTSLRLTGLYLLIIMVISLLFSVSLYTVSTRELDRGFQRQVRFIDDYPDDDFRLPPNFQRQLIKNRSDVASETKAQLFGNLIVTNLVIFLFSGVLSYLLARLSLKPIEESHKSLEQFTADASHELRTPLAVMKSEIEVLLMQKKISDKQAREIFNSNLEEIDSITRLTEGLLSLARHDNSHKKIKSYHLISLLEVAKKKVDSAKKNRIVNININEIDKNIKVKVDKPSFVETLIVVLDNAVKYSKDKGVVEISARRDKEQVVLCIKDFGVGISKDDLPYVFDRFYRSDNHRSKVNHKGYGLGLSIAKQLIEGQQCTISIDSKKDEFTEVLLSIPLSRA